MPEANSSQSVGEVVVLSGSAIAESGAGTRSLEIGSPVYKNDIIRTDDDSNIQIRFTDDTQVSQGENSNLNIDSFVYNSDEADNSDLLLNLMKGTFRTISGEIVKDSPTHFILKTPQSTIGVRGTIVLTHITTEHELVGVEQLGPGKILVVTDSFGNTQIFHAPMQTVELFKGMPVSEVRDLLLQELDQFPPLDTDHNWDEGDNTPLGYTEDNLLAGLGDDVTITGDEGIPDDFGVGEDILFQSDGGELELLIIDPADLPPVDNTTGDTGTPHNTVGPDDVPVALNTTSTDGTVQNDNTVLNLSALNGTNGFTVNGINEKDYSGFSVDGAGDVNGDGLDDLIIGAYGADPNETSGAGESYVVFGGQGNGNINLSDLNGSNGFILNGVYASDDSGFSVSSAGDVNGDGIDDLIIGAFGTESYKTGKFHVVFGGQDWDTISGTDGTIDLMKLGDGLNGFTFKSDSAGDYSGVSVTNAGDVNGDGFDDLLVSVYGANTEAETHIVFGKAGLSGTISPDTTDIVADDFTEISVSGAGDFNGDGLDDVIIGAPEADPNGDSQAGEAYVVFGNEKLGNSIDLSGLNGSNGLTITGIDENDSTGISVSGAGDFNGDGLDDVIIGTQSAGEAYLVFGNKTPGNSIDLNDYNGLTITGIDENDSTAISVSDAGDFNGDGFDDVIVGAYKADGNAGQSYLIFGSDEPGSSIDLSDLDGSNGFAINGIDENDYSGFSVAGAGDVNGDGFDDLIIGAYGADPDGNLDAGESYIIFGNDQTNSVTGQGTTGDDNMTGGLGNDVMIGGLGDDTLNGNGGKDVLYGGAGNDTIKVLDPGFFRVDGGSGTDILRFDGSDDNGLINLTNIADNKINGIERIDLADGSADNHLTLNINDVLNISDTTNELFIDGDENDAITVYGNWTHQEATDAGGYNTYTSGVAELHIDAEITDISIVP